MNYYLVTAKCGHVGRGKYIEVDFPLCAESKSEAAQKCLKRGKVKKQLKNAISSVFEISYDQFVLEIEKYKANEYIKSHCKKEIILFINESKQMESKKSWKKSFENRGERILFKMRKNKIEERLLYA